MPKETFMVRFARLAAGSLAALALIIGIYWFQSTERKSAPPVASKGQGGVTVTNSPVKCVVIRNDKVSLRGSCPR